MIYYLICDETKKFGLKRSYILKDMNFLVFKDFFENFLNYFEFIYFILKKFKNLIIKCKLMW